MDTQFDDKFVLELHLQYCQIETENKEKINLQNLIISQFYGAIRKIVVQYGDFYNEDLFQNCVESTISLLKKWEPNRGSIGGYYRKGWHNVCIEDLRKKQRNMEICVDVSADKNRYVSRDCYDLNLLWYSQDTIFEEKDQEIYEYVLRWLCNPGNITTNTLNLNKTLLIANLRQEFGIKVRHAHFLINHALVTLKLALKDKIRVDEEGYIAGLKPSFMFSRIIPFIKAGNLKDILTVFGGMTVKIPRIEHGINSLPIALED